MCFLWRTSGKPVVCRPHNLWAADDTNHDIWSGKMLQVPGKPIKNSTMLNNYRPYCSLNGMLGETNYHQQKTSQQILHSDTWDCQLAQASATELQIFQEERWATPLPGEGRPDISRTIGFKNISFRLAEKGLNRGISNDLFPVSLPSLYPFLLDHWLNP